jgi:hypothetical protein
MMISIGQSIGCSISVRVQFDADRGCVSLAAHIRERLLGEDTARRKKPVSIAEQRGKGLKLNTTIWIVHCRTDLLQYESTQLCGSAHKSMLDKEAR